MKIKPRNKGVAMIWTAVVAMVVIGFVGFSVDMGYGMLVAHQLQNAADAASLAGCMVVREDILVVQEAAKNIAFENSAAGAPLELSDNPDNAPDGEIVIGRWNSDTKVFTPGLDSPNAVKVVARRTTSSIGGPVALFFAPIFGIDTVDIEREAIAETGGSTGAGMVMLNEEDKWTFRLSGDITLDVRDVTEEDPEGVGGTIQVNSDHIWALKTDGQPTLLASDINVVADDVSDAPEPPVFEGDVNTSSDVMDDPLGGIREPFESEYGAELQTPMTPITGGSITLEPGYYPEGIKITGGEVFFESGGLYVVDGLGLEVTGGDVFAEGVMFFVIDSTPDDNQDSGVTLTGNGEIVLTGLDDEGSLWDGIAIWQQRGNDAQLEIKGTDQFTGIGGTVYVPDGNVKIVGTSDSFDVAQLICDTAELSGSGTLFIKYDGRFPAPGDDVFLVK